jgi:hypothetical protein
LARVLHVSADELSIYNEGGTAYKPMRAPPDLDMRHDVERRSI